MILVVLQNLPVVVAVGGMDPSGGAGLAADILAANSLGVHVAPIVALLTVQTTRGLYAVRAVDPNFVRFQMEQILEDFKPQVIKTGALGSADNIHVVADIVENYGLRLVVDTVWAAGTGEPLIEGSIAGYIDALKKHLLSKAEIVTANIIEASKLVGFEVKDKDSAVKAAITIVREYGAQAAVIKGGHLMSEKLFDVYYSHQHGSIIFEKERIDTCKNRGLHGTGCVFASFIAAMMAKSHDTLTAVKHAEELIHESIRFSKAPGKGRCLVEPLADLKRKAGLAEATNHVRDAINRIMEASDILIEFIPEVGTNISEVILGAETIHDAVGIAGRITKAGKKLIVNGCPEPGGSSHMARLAITAHKYAPDIRAAANLAYNQRLINAARMLGLRVYEVHRAEESDTREGSTMQWIIRKAYNDLGFIPTIIYDKGAHGKEAMIRVLGSYAIEVAELIKRLALIALKLEKG